LPPAAAEDRKRNGEKSLFGLDYHRASRRGRTSTGKVHRNWPVRPRVRKASRNRAAPGWYSQSISEAAARQWRWCWALNHGTKTVPNPARIRVCPVPRQDLGRAHRRFRREFRQSGRGRTRITLPEPTFRNSGRIGGIKQAPRRSREGPWTVAPGQTSRNLVVLLRTSTASDPSAQPRSEDEWTAPQAS